MKKLAFLALLLIGFPNSGATVIKPSWGFFAHRLINRQAVFSLPPEMFTFYKYHLDYIETNAVNPDRRRYAVAGEEENHFLDADVYGDSAFQKLPKYWSEAVEKYGEDSLRKHGIVPYAIQRYAYRLTESFRSRDALGILKNSSDLGHYIGDAHVPLQTTKNYNGQLTGQHGIHGFWESRLPELFSENYNLWIGKASFEYDVAQRAWDALASGHAALDSVLGFESELSRLIGEEKKYSYEDRNGVPTRVYSVEFSKAYHEALSNMVERKMRASIRMVSDVWYTCWIEAGQPELDDLREVNLNTMFAAQADSIKKWGEHLFPGREHQH